MRIKNKKKLTHLIYYQNAKLDGDLESTSQGLFIYGLVLTP